MKVFRQKNIFYIISLLLLLLLLAPKVQASSWDKDKSIQAIKKSGHLKVGVKQDVPNFGYYSPESGRYEGMEIDLAKKIAKSLDVKVDFVPVTAQTREALLDNGQIDIIIATYTITPERQKNYSFSKPYYQDEVGFLINRSSGIKKLKNLNKKRIGVAQGSTTKAAIEEYGKAHKLQFDFVQLGSYPELAISLYAKRIDAFSVDKSILSGYQSKQSKILSGGFNQQSYGVATTKANHKLTDYINQLISKWSTDQSLEKIYQKYNLKPAKTRN
ncbi:transporter substrate-binding domain-containing protein [Streptococcus didelphis]|uniref:Transporter substrate-binding domain-containing protein n=1 Tax=Streptococcus didelphis TaxID=102886 RepID=A0ABY9LI02_9STRE|nr:transporter substrate-binding domain-containing protein [Streptococcus didelphis]WMB28469.1 transporter substrate-binding domain-containing protein [Streptococcus didelphis]WMB29146.1 transporter substrate-binding domain-containing protein [Streptococcus didelphis]